MANTRPVYNLTAPLVDKTGKLIAPWVQFFQQFVQKAPTIVDVSSQSPYTPNQIGTIVVTAGSGISITRGSITINLAGTQAIIPVSIGDTVAWATGTVKFLGA